MSSWPNLAIEKIDYTKQIKSTYNSLEEEKRTGPKEEYGKKIENTLEKLYKEADAINSLWESATKTKRLRPFRKFVAPNGTIQEERIQTILDQHARIKDIIDYKETTETPMETDL